MAQTVSRKKSRKRAKRKKKAKKVQSRYLDLQRMNQLYQGEAWGGWVQE